MLDTAKTIILPRFKTSQDFMNNKEAILDAIIANYCSEDEKKMFDESEKIKGQHGRTPEDETLRLKRKAIKKKVLRWFNNLHVFCYKEKTIAGPVEVFTTSILNLNEEDNNVNTSNKEENDEEDEDEENEEENEETSPKRQGLRNLPFRKWNQPTQELLKKIFDEVFTREREIKNLRGKHMDPVLYEKGLFFNRKEVCERFEILRDRSLNDIRRPLTRNHLHCIANKEKWYYINTNNEEEKLV